MSKLINEGGYGCIYYPGIDCNGDSTKNYLSKIVNKLDAVKEINISKKIKKIPQYTDYFSPIESWCALPYSKLKVPLCKAVTTSFMILKKPYLHSVRPTWTIPSILEMHATLMKSIQLLIRNKIVHFDIKEANILFTPSPKLIDFGISIQMNKVKANISDYFYVYAPEEDVWPIDVHVLCYIVQKDTLSLQSVREICTNFVNYSRILKRCTPTYRKEYLDNSIAYYSTYIPLSNSRTILELLKGWKTWDAYAASMFALKMIHKISPTHPAIESLLQMNHYNPSKRI